MPSTAITVTAFLTAALAEIRIARAGDVPSPDDLDLALTIFNELLDAWNAEQRALYSTDMLTFPLTPNLQPHTIGLTADSPTFAVTTGRPTAIRSANLVISNSIRVPLTLRDSAWWMDLRARAVTSATPSDLFYSADWPLGGIYLWPVPTTAYTLELEIETLLAAVALTDTFSLPQGYQRALRLTLAEHLAPPFGQAISPMTAMHAMEARASIFGNNDTIPTLVTRDAGMPGGGGGGFNFRSGFVE